MAAARQPRYVIVSPIKDEERFVQLALRAVAAQTLLPIAWVIVDDGSTDSTPAILDRYAQRFSFIQVPSSRRAGDRDLGSAEARAFNIGRASIADLSYDYIVKLDGDLSF